MDSKSDEQPGEVVIDFGSEQEPGLWTPVNDVVMGGLSASRFAASGAGSAVFEGSVSMENNGGFASVRRKPGGLGLKKGARLRLAFRGDGHDYKLRLRTTDAFDGVNYEAVFRTTDGAWQAQTFRTDDFTPVWRGQRVRGAPDLSLADVRSIGLLISDEQAGPFHLELSTLTTEPAE